MVDHGDTVARRQSVVQVLYAAGRGLAYVNFNDKSDRNSKSYRGFLAKDTPESLFDCRSSWVKPLKADHEDGNVPAYGACLSMKNAFLQGI